MRIRTINAAIKELKTIDPGTCITPYALRELILNGNIPHSKAGNKYLLDMDDLERYFTASRDGGS